MFGLSQKNSIVIELTKTKKEYFVTYTPHKKEKKIFSFKREDKAYRHILKVLMGYLAGCSEKQTMDYTRLNVIITTLSLVFEVWDITINKYKKSRKQ